MRYLPHVKKKGKPIVPLILTYNKNPNFMDLVRMIQGLGAVSEASGLRRSARQKHGVYALCTHILHVYTVVSRVSTPCSTILLLLPNISPPSPDCTFHRSRCLIGLHSSINGVLLLARNYWEIICLGRTIHFSCWEFLNLLEKNTRIWLYYRIDANTTALLIRAAFTIF